MMVKSVEGTRLDGRMLLNMVNAKHFRIRSWFKFCNATSHVIEEASRLTIMLRLPNEDSPLSKAGQYKGANGSEIGPSSQPPCCSFQR